MRTLLALLIFFAALPARAQSIELKASDGLVVTANVYPVAAGAPWIVLAHMAGASRGEYRQVAPRLNRLGYNAIALDQRSGNAFGGVTNQTAKRARSQGLRQEFTDARPDIEAGIEWARNQGSGPVILWGSSYSASLAVLIAGEDPGLVDGVLAFSPGEYFPGISVRDAARGIQAPILFVSPPSEETQWSGMHFAVPHGDKRSFVPRTGGRHGTSALISGRSKNPGEHWRAVEEFLAEFFPPS